MQNPNHKRVDALSTGVRLLLGVFALAAATAVAGRINLFPSVGAAAVRRSLPAMASPGAPMAQNVITQQQMLVRPGGQPDDHFGLAIAVSGDTAVIGAPVTQTDATRTGQAVVFARTGSLWTYQATLVANDATARNLFGRAVAISGDTIVVGAPFGGNGAAYVFVRSGAVWTQQQRLTASDGTTVDNFGISVGISGDTVVVGADSKDNFAGAAYVFVRSGTAWTQQQRLTASDRIINAFFGTSVAIDGETVIAGAPYRNPSGAAYVFIRVGGTWTEQQKLTPSDGLTGDRFGQSVAISGETALAGCYAGGDRGAAYAFVRSGATWTEQRKLTVGGQGANPGIGYSVGISGNQAIIGAPGAGYGSADQYRGEAIVFARSGNTWGEPQVLSAADGAAGDSFGFAVAISGTTMLVGAPGGASFANRNGKAYVFQGSALSCPDLTVNPAELPSGAIGTAYSQTLTGAGGVPPYTLSITGELPPGVTFSPSTGVLSGTPMAYGAFYFTASITDANGCPSERAYTLLISQNCPVMTVSPATLPNGTVGMAYNQTLTGVGGVGPYHFAVDGELPPGINFSYSNGTFSGTPTTPGTYNLTIYVGNDNDCSSGGYPYTLTINPGSVSSNGLQFYPLPYPVRLLDTRPGNPGCDTPGAPITGGTSRTQTAAGRTCVGLTIPANAKALTGNITTVQSGGGLLTLYPSDAALPMVSNSNFGANEVLNNVFTVRLGATDGAFKIYASSNTHVVVDVTGYYAPPGAGGLYYHPLPLTIRLLDTRPGQPSCTASGGAFMGGSNPTVNGAITCGGITIPQAARALVGNITTVGPQGGGYLALYQAGIGTPYISSANYYYGQMMNTPFTVRLSAAGQFAIFTTTTTHLMVDVMGYYSTEANDVNGAGLLFNPLSTPIRLLETRPGQPGCRTSSGLVGGYTTLTTQARITCGGVTIGNAARAIVGNATVVNATGGYLTLWPSGTARPLVSSSNYQTGQVFNRHFTTVLGADGAFQAYASATTDLVIDVSGFFAP